MVSNNCPRRVWEFGLKHTAKVIHMIPSEKLNPIEAVMGETPDILEYVDFGFMIWCGTIQEIIPLRARSIVHLEDGWDSHVG